MPILHRCHGVGGEGCGVLSEGVRCPAHTRLRERRRTQDKRAQRPYTGAERDRRAAAVRAWLLRYGPRCPGTRGRGWHTVAPEDLTAEHGHAVAAGGDESQLLTVLCRPCNSSKQDRYIE